MAATDQVSASGTRDGRQASQLRSLMVIAAAVGASRRFDDVLELAAEEALAALAAASLSISRWERDADLLRTLINVGDLGPQEERYPADECYPLSDWPEVATVLRKGEHYIRSIDDPVTHPRDVDLLTQLGKESEAGVPIMFEGRMWGELYATTGPGQPRFSDADLQFLKAVATQVALGLAHAAYLGKLEELAFPRPADRPGQPPRSGRPARAGPGRGARPRRHRVTGRVRRRRAEADQRSAGPQSRRPGAGRRRPGPARGDGRATGLAGVPQRR